MDTVTADRHDELQSAAAAAYQAAAATFGTPAYAAARAAAKVAMRDAVAARIARRAAFLESIEA